MDTRYRELYEKLATLQWLLHRRQISAHAEHGPCADPTRGQGRVLTILRMQPEISTKDLSYVLGIRQQSLNELLNKLEKNGLVERKPSESDRRVMIVHLTDKGKDTQQVDRDYADIFACLDDDELTAFSSYLDKIINALEEQVGDDFSDEKSEWVEAARSKMGDEKFERLMSMRHGGFARAGFGMFAKEGFGHADFGGFGYDRSHNDRPTSEDFQCDEGFQTFCGGFDSEERRGPRPGKNRKNGSHSSSDTVK